MTQRSEGYGDPIREDPAERLRVAPRQLSLQLDTTNNTRWLIEISLSTESTSQPGTDAPSPMRTPNLRRHPTPFPA